MKQTTFVLHYFFGFLLATAIVNNVAMANFIALESSLVSGDPVVGDAFGEVEAAYNSAISGLASSSTQVTLLDGNYQVAVQPLTFPHTSIDATITSNNGHVSARVSSPPFASANGPEPDLVLRNNDNFAPIEATIDFSQPLRAFGFLLFDDDDFGFPPTSTISFFGPGGSLLGTITTVPGPDATPNKHQFIGGVTTGNAMISRVEIDATNNDIVSIGGFQYAVPEPSCALLLASFIGLSSIGHCRR